MFKNTFKLLGSNFSTVWKLLLYKFIVIAITVGLFCVILGHLGNLESFQNLTSSLWDWILNFNFSTTPTTIVGGLETIFSNLFAFVVELVTTLPFVFAYFIILFFLILPFLWHLSDIAVAEGLFGHMASLTKYPFAESFIRKFGISAKYSLTLTIFLLPLNLILGGIIYFLSTLIGASSIIASLTPTFLVVACIIYFAIRFSILPLWPSVIVTENCGVWKAFAKMIKISCKNFFKYFSNTIFLSAFFILLILLTTLFGYAILCPLFSYIVSIFGIVAFFQNQGMRYYVDFDTIIKPQKLEQVDKIKKLKNII